MKPCFFKGQNVVLAKDQIGYRDSDGQVTSCWELTFIERIKVLFFGRIYFTVMTFNKPLQPQLPSVDNPVLADSGALQGKP